METLIYLYIFFIGSLLFSFYMVLGYRIPIKKTLKGRSECDNCGNQLSFFDVLPIFSYIFSLGKCKYCKQKITPWYLLFELFGGVLFLYGYLLFDFTIDYLVYLLLVSLLFIESVSDFFYFYVSDRILVIVYFLMLPILIIKGVLLESLISSISIFTILFMISYFGEKIFKKTILGMGDVKFYLVVGLFINFIYSIISFYIASILVLIMYNIRRQKDKEIKFIPYLSIGIFIMYMYGEKLINLYLSTW